MSIRVLGLRFEIGAGRVRVVEDAGLELVDRGKLLLRAQELVKLQPHLTVVEVAVVVEDEALDAHALAAADRRPHADIRDGVMLAAVVEIHLRGVHAVARHEHPVRKLHVDRGRAHLRAKAVAIVHRVRQGVRMAEESVGALDLAVLEQLADISGADDAAVERDGGNNVAAKAALGAVGGELFRRALAPPAKAEVVPDDERCRVHLVDKRLDERLPRHLHDRAVKVDKDHALDAEQAADELLAAVGAVDERDLRAEHERVRVHVKAHDRGDGAHFFRARDCAAHERGMADMDPVKKAQGNDTFLVFHTSRNLEKTFDRDGRAVRDLRQQEKLPRRSIDAVSPVR